MVSKFDNLSDPSCFMLFNMPVSLNRQAGPHAALADLLNQEVLTIVPMWQKGFSSFLLQPFYCPQIKRHICPILHLKGIRCLHSGLKCLHGIHQFCPSLPPSVRLSSLCVHQGCILACPHISSILITSIWL